MLITPDTFNEAIEKIQTQPKLAVDLETTGLNPWKNQKGQDQICGIAIHSGIDGWYFPFGHSNSENCSKEQKEVLTNLLSRKEVLCNHNINFDRHFLSRIGCNTKEVKVVDTLLGAHLLNENDNNKLKALADKHLGTNSSEAEKHLTKVLMSWGYAKDDMWRLPAELVAPYAIQDTKLALALEGFLDRRLDKRVRPLWDELNEYSTVIFKMVERGIRCDTDTVKELRNEAYAKCTDLEQRIKSVAGRHVNPSSPASVGKWLLVQSTEEEHLSKLKAREGVPELLQFRSWKKGIDTYYNKYLELVCEDGRLHCDMRITGTGGGRLSTANPNLQAVPRYTEEQKVRKCLKPTEGKVFLEVDYSQAEIRLAAHYTKEQTIIEALKKGKDLHQFVADEAGIDRQTAKTINFSIIYGSGPGRLAEQLGIPVNKAKEFLYNFHDRFPKYKQLTNQAQKMAEERGAIRYWTGRLRHFDGPESEPHTAFNQLIQGGVSEIIRRAMTAIDAALPEKEAAMVLQVHDAILFEVEPKELKHVYHTVKEIMEYQPEFDVPFVVDAKIGPSYGEMVKYNGKDAKA
jgi:DNA polymerase-1